MFVIRLFQSGASICVEALCGVWQKTHTSFEAPLPDPISERSCLEPTTLAAPAIPAIPARHKMAKNKDFNLLFILPSLDLAIV